MNIKQAVESANAKLSNAQPQTKSPSISDSTNLDARLLVCHACNIEQTQLISHPEKKLNFEQEKLFNSILDRRTKGEPLAYITGNKEFWSLEFAVNKHVLIPRPETELLVELTLEAISNIKSPRILELGTGSGAIAISIFKEREDAKIVATDICLQALEIAKQNAGSHQAGITFVQSSWYEKLAEEKFDVIVCNPPYIAKDDQNLDEHVSQYEPSKALISNKDGLEDIEMVIAGAKQYLSSAGYLAIEHGFKQGSKVHQLFDQYQFESTQTHKDLAGLDRVTISQNPKTV